MSRSVLLASTLLTLSACSLPFDVGPMAVSSQCTVDNDCGASGVCIEEACVSTKADLGGLILQIDVPVGASYAQGTSHLLRPENLTGSRNQGFIIDQDLILPELAAVTVSMAVSADAFPTCSGAETTIELAPANAPAGISLPPFTTSATLTPCTEGECAGQLVVEAVVSVPAGVYDIYLRPVANTPNTSGVDTIACDLPPAVLESHSIDAGSVQVTIDGGQPSIVTGAIEGYSAIAGFTIDIVENRHGRIISTQQILGEPQFALQFWPQVMEGEGVEGVIRLVPPKEQQAMGIPTIFWKLEALQIFGTGGEVNLSLANLDPSEAVAVTGKVVTADGDSTVLPAQLAIRSTELLGGQLSGTAIYTRTLETDEDLNFSLSLLPGKYDVIANPNDDDYAVTRDQLTILSGSDQGGKTIEVDLKTKLAGAARLASGSPAFDVSVALSPTFIGAPTFLKSQLNQDLSLGTSASTTTDGQGAFEVAVDSGTYTLWLHPDPNSGLPWAVLSRLTVPEVRSEAVPKVDLVIGNPVVLSGTVRSPTGDRIEGARIRAWLAPPKLDADAEEPSVIQIGAVTSQGLGRYELLLPPSINASTSL
ncbi:MAG: hypothetical protein R3B72_02090 [Polyangiaceae bacterium]